MIAIIISVLAIVFCALVVLDSVERHKPVTGILFFLLTIMNTVFLVININIYRKNHEEMNTSVVHNVKGYQIDSTFTINSTDTTKTYTITYWK